MVRKISLISTKNILGDNLSFNQVLSKLAGVSEREISNINSGRHECANIGELITELYIALQAHLKLDLLEIGGVEEYKVHGLDTRFEYKVNPKGKRRYKRGVADMRIDRTPLEIKTQLEGLGPKSLEDILCKYGKDSESYWEDHHESCEDPILFLHMDRRLYEPYLGKIKSVGIKTVEQKEFKRGLTKMFEEAQNKNLLEDVTPKIETDYILRIYDELCDMEAFKVLSRAGMKDTRSWLTTMIKELINRISKSKETDDEEVQNEWPS